MQVRNRYVYTSAYFSQAYVASYAYKPESWLRTMITVKRLPGHKLANARRAVSS